MAPAQGSSREEAGAQEVPEPLVGGQLKLLPAPVIVTEDLVSTWEAMAEKPGALAVPMLQELAPALWASYTPPTVLALVLAQWAAALAPQMAPPVLEASAMAVAWEGWEVAMGSASAPIVFPLQRGMARPEARLSVAPAAQEREGLPPPPMAASLGVGLGVAPLALVLVGGLVLPLKLAG